MTTPELQDSKMMDVGRWQPVILLIATVLSGLSAGLSLSHVLEIPGKHSLNGQEFLQVQHTFYGGYAIFGAVAWILIILISLFVGIRLFNLRRPVAILCLSAAVCFLIALGIFGVFLSHYNGLIANWQPATLPHNWQTVRDHWEVSHVVVFALSTAAFIALVRAENLLLVPAAYRRSVSARNV